MNAPCFFETSITIYLLTKHHIPENLYLLQAGFYIYININIDDNLMSLSKNTTMNNDKCIQLAIKDI